MPSTGDAFLPEEDNNGSNGTAIKKRITYKYVYLNQTGTKSNISETDGTIDDGGHSTAEVNATMQLNFSEIQGTRDEFTPEDSGQNKVLNKTIPTNHIQLNGTRDAVVSDDKVVTNMTSLLLSYDGLQGTGDEFVMDAEGNKVSNRKNVVKNSVKNTEINSTTIVLNNVSRNTTSTVMSTAVLLRHDGLQGTGDEFVPEDAERKVISDTTTAAVNTSKIKDNRNATSAIANETISTNNTTVIKSTVISYGALEGGGDTFSPDNSDNNNKVVNKTIINSNILVHSSTSLNEIDSSKHNRNDAHNLEETLILNYDDQNVEDILGGDFHKNDSTWIEKNVGSKKTSHKKSSHDLKPQMNSLDITEMQDANDEMLETHFTNSSVYKHNFNFTTNLNHSIARRVQEQEQNELIRTTGSHSQSGNEDNSEEMFLSNQVNHEVSTMDDEFAASNEIDRTSMNIESLEVIQSKFTSSHNSTKTEIKNVKIISSDKKNSKQIHKERKNNQTKKSLKKTQSSKKSTSKSKLNKPQDKVASQQKYKGKGIVPKIDASLSTKQISKSKMNHTTETNETDLNAIDENFRLNKTNAMNTVINSTLPKSKSKPRRKCRKRKKISTTTSAPVKR